MKETNKNYSRNVKRYVAEDMRQALKQIREELGPDAVILSNRRVRDGVEIITSAEALTDNDAPVLAEPFVEKVLDQPKNKSTEDNRDEIAKRALLQQERDQQKETIDSVPEQTQPKVALQAKVTSTGSAIPRSAPAAHFDLAEPNSSLSVLHQVELPTEQSVQPSPRYADKGMRGSAPLSNFGQQQVDKTFGHLLEKHSVPLHNEPNQITQKPNESDQLVDVMRSEIKSLRVLLRDKMVQNSADRWAFKHPLQATVKKYLVSEGISDLLARELVGTHEHHSTIDQAWNGALAKLSLSIPTLAHDLIDDQGIIALLGTTGAGKTTIISKLAVHYALRHGAEHLALVSTDSYRLAAYQQLSTLGRIINVPVHQVNEQNSLESVLELIKGKSMILIDTAGFHLADKNRLKQLDLLKTINRPVKKLLVLPSTIQSKLLHSVYESMPGITFDGCVLSKVDENSSLGEVLNFVVEKQLPVAYISNGQKIPNDLSTACSKALVQCLSINRAQSAPDKIVQAPIYKMKSSTPDSTALYA